jgi:hypothetical protein
MEVCLMTARMGAAKVLIILTAWDYPQSAPTARAAPFIPMGPEDDLYTLMEQLWDESEAVTTPPGWAWSPDKHLVDYIHALEDQLGIPRTPAPEPAAEIPAQSEPTVEEPEGSASEETP